MNAPLHVLLQCRRVVVTLRQLGGGFSNRPDAETAHFSHRHSHRVSLVKLAFHGADTDTDFLADILARSVARMSACRSACHRNNSRKSRVRRVGEDHREDIRVGVGVVELHLYTMRYPTVSVF